MKLKIASCSSLFAMLVVILTLLATPANAITWNPHPDGDAHPYVGLMVFDVGGRPMWRTSGFLISPTVMVTAGHGTNGTSGGRVWFDEVVEGNPDYPWGGPSSVEMAEIHTHPDFDFAVRAGFPEWVSHDVGVVILDTPVILPEYAQLPTVGLVDTLEVMTEVDLVGYGWQIWDTGGGRPGWSGPRNRFNASARLITSNHIISDEFVRVTANPGQGKGGATFGDSGGPVLLSGTNTAVAVNSFGPSYPCGGISYSYRIDNADVLAWINGLVGP